MFHVKHKKVIEKNRSPFCVLSSILILVNAVVSVLE